MVDDICRHDLSGDHHFPLAGDPVAQPGEKGLASWPVDITIPSNRFMGIICLCHVPQAEPELAALFYIHHPNNAALGNLVDPVHLQPVCLHSRETW